MDKTPLETAGGEAVTTGDGWLTTGDGRPPETRQRPPETRSSARLKSGGFLNEQPVNHKLEGKVSIITGGASGIGEATARLFANHGVCMIIIADIQDELGQQVAISIGAHRCNYMHCDVTHQDQVKALVESTVGNFGQLDIMFSNAGIIGSPTTHQTVVDLDMSAFDSMFAVNIRGMAACVKHAARAMVEGSVRGSIVCTASVAANHGGKKCNDYYMLKHAVVGLVRSASVQLGMHGIRVNCISPYVLAWPATCLVNGVGIEELERLYNGNTLLKGVTLRAKHAADGVLFLASNESELITGHDLVVDGGFQLT
ncbi:hypothetical protein Dsin_006143 [Dipteronia sinensis]|uniref:(21S)-21-acetoxyl-apo-melianone synthase SDR n=1 Tax=Dipteronia sinensis TaxID=43782 RepID=A0AAE0EFC8_9ROSI|nr:hypothetical protein Dsin_006143 [Dipteronia sinensis]